MSNIKEEKILRMVVQNWMDAWLKIKVYESKRKCKKHVNKYETVFCCECMGEPVCELCWNESKSKHEGHQSLQVYAASGRTAIEVTEITKFWDISEIQKYKINNKFVVYLNPNVQGAEEHKQNPKCEVCKRRVMESKNRFCSIACKKTSNELPKELSKESKPVEPKKRIELSKPVELEKRNESGTPKKRRKGNPIRSLLNNY